MWVDSEETQDYVRAAKSTDQEDAEELCYVSSTISVTQKLMFRCDNQCSEKTLSFWHLASVVIQEGEESHTTNICQKCYRESLKARGENTGKLAVETVRGAKGAPWMALEDDGKRSIRARNVGILLPRERVKRFREQAEEEKAGWNKRSVAAGIASQRVLGAS